LDLCCRSQWKLRKQATMVHHIFTAIPFRREPNGDTTQYTDVSLSQVLTRQYSSELWTSETTVTSDSLPKAGVDGWRSWFAHLQVQPKVGIRALDRVPLPEGRIGLRWAALGFIETALNMSLASAGESHQFAFTSYHIRG